MKLEQYQIDFLNDTIEDLSIDIEEHSPSTEVIHTIFAMLSKHENAETIIDTISTKNEQIHELAFTAIQMLASKMAFLP